MVIAIGIWASLKNRLDELVSVVPFCKISYLLVCLLTFYIFLF